MLLDPVSTLQVLSDFQSPSVKFLLNVPDLLFQAFPFWQLYVRAIVEGPVEA